MPKEREHKFILNRDRFPFAFIDGYLIKKDSESGISEFPAGKHFVQGYVSVKPTVRVRLVDVPNEQSVAYLTIKGDGVIERSEYEYQIPVDHAREMLGEMCEDRIVEKTRYCIDNWEIDVFEGRHKSLMLVEYEIHETPLPSLLPAWVGKEVTQDKRYSNANLAVNGLSKIILD